ncbi:MAG TPA: class I SAM-dependent methyltransferase [Anaerolineaceae bacterium]|nr:class I SAM-dependent methyltransferase [Anaerolineaceae bacterium]
MSEKPPICNYEGSDYQTSFWDQADRAYEDAVEAVALKRLLPSGGKLLLELGAGAGRNTPRYAGFERVVLLDYSTTQLKQAQARLGSENQYIYVAADVYHLPFVNGLFDGATMIRTLHHMADAPKALQQIYAVMQENAVFILEYANKKNLKAIFRYLLGRQKWNPFSPEPVEFAALNFDFHPRAIRSWLAEAGFKPEKQLTVSHYRMAIIKKVIPLKLLVWMDSVAQLTGDAWQLSPSVFTRNKAVGSKPNSPQGHFFKCPVCDTLLEDTPPILVCMSCGQNYPVNDGIYDFRLDELNKKSD